MSSIITRYSGYRYRHAFQLLLISSSGGRLLSPSATSHLFGSSFSVVPISSSSRTTPPSSFSIRSVTTKTKTSVFHKQMCGDTATKLFAGSPATTSLTFGTNIETYKDGDDYDATVIIGRKESIESLILTKDDGTETATFLTDTLGLDVSNPILHSMVDAINVKTGGSSNSYVSSAREDKVSKAHKLFLCGLPTDISRNNHLMAVHSMTAMAGKHVPKEGNIRVIVVLPDQQQKVAPLASAIAKAFPVFTRKTSAIPPKERNVNVIFCDTNGDVVSDEDQLHAAQAVAKGVQLAGRLIDTHPEEMTTDQFAIECQSIVDEFANANADANNKKRIVKMTQLVGDELKLNGYGGLYGVGKAATCPPRLVVLEYNGGGEDSTVETVALVGKGIVYDTGGLSLKPGAGMAGMKHDMGGAAGLLGGFYSAVSLEVKKNVTLILCLAENAIGPTAFRNDDILTMYSGKTVEVNNCDAEGRLVLGDGVAHATKHIPNLDLVVDMATLTGAQLVATGKIHAGILANTVQVEERAMDAGKHSGDLVYPLLYAPEFLMDEFKSSVADMKNSVKDRGNAQTSCAGHFIESHLHKDYKGGWLHVDMAGPGTKDERGTGYGVGLVLSLLEAPGF